IKTFNGLLSIARLEAGAASEAMEEIDVGALILDVVELYEPAAEDKGLSLTARAPEGVSLTADRQLIGQALANLIDNAIKYSGDDGAGGAIEVSAAETADAIELIVSDSGPGIPEKDRERVLKRFVRLEESRSRPGSGLGLSLVAAVARLHGGEVRLDDNKPGLRAVLSLSPETNHNGPAGAQ
ncbi:MAG: sensor histidine kinase, partial [Methyloligellaceae bacterium]